MTAVIVSVFSILFVICIGQAVYIRRAGRQLSEWLDYLKSIKSSPYQKYFIKDSGILAEINFEMNDILEENRRQLIRLTKAEEANKQILTNLSHDVRTPLASLLGYLEALEQGREGISGQKEYIHTAYRKALNLKEYIDILFEWFKLNANEAEYQFSEYDVNELTRQVIIGYLPIVERENVTMEVHISEEEWPLLIDRIAYERIINNLLGNALKHGKCSKIAVNIQKNDGRVMIEITNNGAVIPKEEIPYIFERLYQCDSARSQSGSGLGLAIVKELVTVMQGEITARSSPEQETSFCLTFPLFVRKK